jgi:hypothetical protein
MTAFTESQLEDLVQIEGRVLTAKHLEDHFSLPQPKAQEALQAYQQKHNCSHSLFAVSGWKDQRHLVQITKEIHFKGSEGLIL